LEPVTAHLPADEVVAHILAAGSEEGNLLAGESLLETASYWLE
jgi:hypothetical protein